MRVKVATIEKPGQHKGMPQMTNQAEKWITGGCHCGNVRFKVWIESVEAIECNCSICLKKGFINLITKPNNFVLLQGEGSLATYQFNTEVAKHQFCTNCGIHPFSRPRSHPDGYDVKSRCFDDGFDFLSRRPFDGQNWEKSVHSIR